MSNKKWYNELKVDVEETIGEVEETNESIEEWLDMVEGYCADEGLCTASEAVGYIRLENNENIERWTKLCLKLINVIKKLSQSE